MKWYAAHAVMYVKWKQGRQNVFPVWENVLLIKAKDGRAALRLARARAREDAGDSRGSLVWDGRPAVWKFGGIRKVIACQEEASQPTHGQELTYSEFLVGSRRELEKLIKGKSARVDYVE